MERIKKLTLKIAILRSYFRNQTKKRLLMKGIQPKAIKGTKIKLITRVRTGAGKSTIIGIRIIDNKVMMG